MPNTKSAAKRLRQDKVRQIRNRAAKSEVKTQMKKVVAAVEAGEIESAEEMFKSAAKKLDQAGANGVIHRNKAARQKSRLQNRIKKAKSADGS